MPDSDESVEIRKRYFRHFTVMALFNCQLLALSLSDVRTMGRDFPEQFAEVFQEVRDHMKQQLLLKLEVTKILEIGKAKLISNFAKTKAGEEGAKSEMQKNITVNLLGGLQKEIK